MTIEEILKKARTDANGNDVITELRAHRYTANPTVAEAEKALDIKNHDVNNPAIRKDKKVAVTDDDAGESAKKVITTDGESVNYRTEKVNRVAIAMQKRIISLAVSFCFGNPVTYNSTPTNDSQKAIAKALSEILSDVKAHSIDRRIGRRIFGYQECAEYWYPVEKQHSKYGFDSQFKLRCQIFSPKDGDTLWPYFDETGDMVAFSREFSRIDSNGVAVGYFETFTDTEHWLWVSGQGGFQPVEGYPKPNPIGKIPVVYGYQDHLETEDVDNLIARLETLLSNFADTDDYHGSPKIFVTGEIRGFARKGESGAVIEGEPGATMQYVTWANAPESIKLEIDTLLKLIHMITQTPDLSFDSVKGIGAISGVALKLLFMDPHLKVQDKREIFDDYFQRRANILEAYIGMMNTKLEKECQNFPIEPEIVPYMITSDLDDLEYWMTANGNKPVISQEESVEKAGISRDPELTMQKIKDEDSSANTFQIGEPVVA